MDRPKADPQRAVDAAIILPFAAAALLTPPLILIFAAPMTLAGIPLILIYVFGAWAIIIIVAQLLTRRLATPDIPLDSEQPPAVDSD